MSGGQRPKSEDHCAHIWDMWLVLLAVCASAAAFDFVVPAYERTCFYEETYEPGTSLSGTFVVRSPEGTTTDFRVRDERLPLPLTCATRCCSRAAVAARCPAIAVETLAMPLLRPVRACAVVGVSVARRV